MTTPLPFPNQYSPLVNGQPVDAGVVNNPLSTLQQRTVSLHETITEAVIGNACLLRDAPLEGANVLPGMAVYRDVDGVFKPGIAALELAPDGVTLQLAESAYVWGVVQSKSSNTVGHVATNGSITVAADELADVMVDGVATAGPLFLSATPNQYGKLTKTQPPLGVMVCVAQGPTADNKYNLFVNVGWKNPFEGHIHLFRRISNSLSDWESAATFTSNTGRAAPVGAQYRFKHQDDAVLSVLWPPMPISAVHYDLDGTATDLVTNDRILIDDDGIWWMAASPALTGFRHDFYFTRMTFKTSNAIVTSLRPADDSVTITDVNGNDATTGDLKISAALNVSVSTSTVKGTAVKEATGSTLKFGRVVDSIRTTTPDYVSITATNVDSSYNYGDVLLNVLPAEAPREGPVEFVNLDSVTIENYNDVFYLALKNSSTPSVILGRFQLPLFGLPNGMDVYLDSLLLSKASGTLPASLPVSYLVVPRPGSTNTPASLSTTFSNHGTGIVLGGATTANYYLRNELLLCQANPGDIIYFKITRNGVGGYSGDIGLMNQRWRVTV